MSKRRLQLILSLTFSALIVGYWGFYEPEYQLPPLSSHQADQQIDGYIVNPKMIEYDEQGLPKQELIAKRLTHYPETDKSIVEQPDILVHRQDQQPIRIVAEEGEIGPNQQEILLRRDVSIIEQQADGFEMETPFLRIEPDNDYAETNAPVTLRTSSGTTRSVGMKAYLSEDRIELLDRVRGSYEPR